MGYASGGGSHRTNFATRQRRSCCLCKAKNRREWKDNFLSQCPFLPEEGKKYLASKIRDVEVEEQGNIEGACSTGEEAMVSRVDVVAFLVLEALHRGVDTKLTLDTGGKV